MVALEPARSSARSAAGALFAALGGNVTLTLLVPAIAVTLVFFAILFGVPESEPLPGRKLDTFGFVLLTLGLLLITSGLSFLRINIENPWWWVAIPIMLVGVLVFLPWGGTSCARQDPAIDLRVLRQPNMWPVQLTAGLVGISLLGAQAPLSDLRRHRPGERLRARTGVRARSRTSSAPTWCR